MDIRYTKKEIELFYCRFVTNKIFKNHYKNFYVYNCDLYICMILTFDMFEAVDASGLQSLAELTELKL